MSELESEKGQVPLRGKGSVAEVIIGPDDNKPKSKPKPKPKPKPKEKETK